LAELLIRECRMGVRQGPCRPPKTDAARYPRPDALVLLIIGVTIGTISTDRPEGAVRDSGCPAAVRTANFRTKSRAQDDWQRTRRNKFTQMN
jgi:hypothetical protein